MSVAVIAVLLSLLMPGLAAVRETARRVVCASNVRQTGLGLAMYADDYRGVVPASRFTAATGELHRMSVVRVSSQWDGLGSLYGGEYLNAADVFYCPSHLGTHPLTKEKSSWTTDKSYLVSNYHFRGVDPAGTRVVWRMNPTTTLVSDSLASVGDFSHQQGTNVLQAGLAVRWVNDPATVMMSILPNDKDTPATASKKVATAWVTLDGWDGGKKILTPADTTPYSTTQPR